MTFAQRPDRTEKVMWITRGELHLVKGTAHEKTPRQEHELVYLSNSEDGSGELKLSKHRE